MQRLFLFAYGIACHVGCLVTFLYAIGFVGNLLVPKSIDSAPVAPLAPSLAIDFALFGLFALQHSGLARPACQRWLRRRLPAEAVSSTYVLTASSCLALVMWLWAPLGGVIWDLGSGWAARLVTGLYLASAALLLYAAVLACNAARYLTAGGHRLVQLPGHAGWLGLFWCTPTMTVTHLVFAATATFYIVTGMRLEARNREAGFRAYRRHPRRVPVCIPSLRRRPTRRSDTTAG